MTTRRAAVIAEFCAMALFVGLALVGAMGCDSGPNGGASHTTNGASGSQAGRVSDGTFEGAIENIMALSIRVPIGDRSKAIDEEAPTDADDGISVSGFGSAGTNARVGEIARAYECPATALCVLNGGQDADRVEDLVVVPGPVDLEVDSELGRSAIVVRGQRVHEGTASVAVNGEPWGRLRHRYLVTLLWPSQNRVVNGDALDRPSGDNMPIFVSGMLVVSGSHSESTIASHRPMVSDNAGVLVVDDVTFRLFRVFSWGGGSAVIVEGRRTGKEGGAASKVGRGAGGDDPPLGKR